MANAPNVEVAAMSSHPAKERINFRRNLRKIAESEKDSLKRKRQEDKKKRNTSSKRIRRLKGYALVIIGFGFIK